MYSRWVSPHSVLGTERSLLGAVYLKGERGRGKGRERDGGEREGGRRREGEGEGEGEK